LILALVMAQPVAAQSFKPDFKVAKAAADRKDYATALKHIRPLAEQGDAKAQNSLGVMYIEGFGVPIRTIMPILICLSEVIVILSSLARLFIFRYHR
jgi:TPR repeat protein